MGRNTFQQQLLQDIETLHRLIVRYARGDRSARRARDRLEGAIQIKFALWKAIRRHQDRED